MPQANSLAVKDLPPVSQPQYYRALSKVVNLHNQLEVRALSQQ
jgi:hypothetical protein